MWRWIPAVVTSAFVMAGFIKDTGVLALLPFDLTLALGLLTALIVGVRLIVSDIPRAVHGVVLAFALLVPPALWSAPTEYGSDKVLRLFTFTILAIIAPIVLIRDERDVARHLWAMTGMCGIVVVSALVDPRLSSAYTGAPITTESVDTIGLGSAAGHVVVVVALGLIWKAVPRLAIVAAAAAVYVMLQSGSRGPLLFALSAVLVGSLLARKRPDPRRVAIFGALLAVGGIVAFQAAPLYSQLRILAVLTGMDDTSVDGRYALYRDAFDSILRHPLGIGWGSFEGITFGGYRWPHDVPLEVLAEAGLVFGGLFLGWLCLQILRAHRITVDYPGAAVFAVVIFRSGHSLVSSDINDNRVVRYAIGIAIAAGGVRAANVGRGTSFTDVSSRRPSRPDRQSSTADATRPLVKRGS